MDNFADQCLDMARSFLSHNLDSINEDGTISPFNNEPSRSDESGHAALAIGEYYRATGETTLGKFDLIDLAARTITAQAFMEDENDVGLAYAALGLLSFGPSKDRNPVWERLMDETREMLDKRLLARADYDNHLQAFNIAKSVARFSMGLSKKDETGRLVDLFLERIQSHSSGGYCDDMPQGMGGAFDIYGVLAFIFIRQSLQLHSNISLRERKLPSIRTFAEKYLRLLPDVVRQDGLGWAFGKGIGAYGQMHCISIILQSLRDQWIGADKKAQYLDIVRRLFAFFFTTYLDQENGFLVIRDEERNAMPDHTTRMANFDAARYLCQWSRLAKTIGGQLSDAVSVPAKKGGRFVVFDKSSKKEQGLFIYNNPESGLQIQIPLIGSNGKGLTDSLPFPHCPGVFDWPVDKYLPVMLPELTFGDNVVLPAFYGKNCVTGLGLRNSIYFRYEQPDLMTIAGEKLGDLGSCKVNWTFSGNKITAEFIFIMKNQVQLDNFRFVLALAAPHSQHRVGISPTLGEESLRASVVTDDFHATWQETEVVSHDPSFATYYGKIHYLQTLARTHPLIMKPNHPYKLVVEFDPDIKMVDE